MENMIHSLDQIPKDVIDLLLRQFEDTQKARALKDKITHLHLQGKYMHAMKEQQKYDNMFREVLVQYAHNHNRQLEYVPLGNLPFSPEQRERCDATLLALYMALDIIETCVMDVDDLIKAADKSCSFEDMKEVRVLATLVKAQIKGFQRKSDYMQSQAYFDAVDKQFEMLYKKALSIKRKHDGGKLKKNA